MKSVSREVKRALNEEQSEENIKKTYYFTIDRLKEIYKSIKSLKPSKMNNKWFNLLFKPVLVYKDINGEEDFELNKAEYIKELAKELSDYYFRYDKEISEVQLKVHYGYVDVLAENGKIKNEKTINTIKSIASQVSKYISNKYNGKTHDGFKINVEYDSDMLHIYIDNVDVPKLFVVHQILDFIAKDYIEFLDSIL